MTGLPVPDEAEISDFLSNCEYYYSMSTGHAGGQSETWTFTSIYVRDYEYEDRHSIGPTGLYSGTAAHSFLHL
jgi:hypothetical protein